MTRRASARVAGFAFLVYIAVSLAGMSLSSRAAGGDSAPAEKLASIARHAGDVRAAVLLDLAGCFCALVLAVSLYVITRETDPNLSLLILVFRAGEGVIGALSLPRGVGRLWLATASGPAAPDPAAANVLATVLLKLPSWNMPIGASFFAVGSLVFSYLLVRGRLVPAALGWLGLLASVLIVVSLPLQLVGILEGTFTQGMWFPMLAFELILAFWLIVKGAAMPPGRQSA